jgi:large subunit ribosomal protein L2
MGKKIRAQRKGRGSPTFKASTHKRVAESSYPNMKEAEEPKLLKGTVEDLVHDPGRGAPLAKIRLVNGKTFFSVAVESLAIGQEVFIGSDAPINIGNILPLGNIPAGTIVNNIELATGDGGKIAKASGSYATIVAETPKGIIVKFPSGKSSILDKACKATIGVVSGSGRASKPFMKAGKKVMWMKAKGRAYPFTRGIAMIPALHPHGGGSHKSKSLKPTSVSRQAPPGQKVGHIAPKQSGRKKRKR